MKKQYYYNNFGVQAGPISEDALLDKLHSGKLSGSTVIWCEGMADWKAAAQIFPEIAVPVKSSSKTSKTKKKFKFTPDRALAANCFSLGILILVYIVPFVLNFRYALDTVKFLCAVGFGIASAAAVICIFFAVRSKSAASDRTKVLEYGIFNIPLLVLFVILLQQSSVF